MQVVTPTGNVLVDDLTLRVEPGSNLLITGSYLNFLLVAFLFLFIFLRLKSAMTIDIYYLFISRKSHC